MKYQLFFTGLASVPNSVGLKCLTTNEVICEIETACDSGKQTRIKYQKYLKILKDKFKTIL